MFVKLVIKTVYRSDWQLKSSCATLGSGLLSRLARAVWQAYQYENNSSIAWNSTFRGEPCFPHGMKSIFVSGDAVIGKNCVIFQQVTIGSNTLKGSSRFGAPIIGDNVYIGAGAKIIGKVSIGDNCRIGANAVVSKDVPSNSIVIGAEQRVITRESPPDNRFFSHRGRWKYFDDGQWCEDELSRISDDGR